MKICPACMHANREGFMFCEECGQNIENASNVTLPTREIESVTNIQYSRATWGTARFNNESWIVLHVRDATDPIVFQPTKDFVLGRYDSSSAAAPDLDLGPFGALDKGVSRMHATIARHDNTLMLVDLGSANGTHLNGQRLAPEQPRVLRDGDEIRLGKLVIHIYFRSSPAA